MTDLNKEARLLAIRIRAKAIEGELLSMRMHDEAAIRNGTGTYTEKAYQTLVRGLERLAEEAEVVGGKKLWMSIEPWG